MNRELSISNKTTDSSSQAAVASVGENNAPNIAPSQPGQPGPPEHSTSRSRNQVLKSGNLFISSKGIGWTSWKKRWFVLTRTSLVFFRSDPSAAPQKGSETNLTLGGIDLNNSASVEVKADKKLLTVFFPDGRDGRAFTLKAETLDDLYEWKTALETAVAQAPTASANGQNMTFNNEQEEAPNEPPEPQNERLPGKSMVIGRPVLLALEDIDGSPSFLEKALRFVETHGVKVEGILRQAADVELVYRRVNEYEQGKTEFAPNEDAHVIGDCIKYILRELPSSPVPATCCTALLEAFRSDRNNRLNNMRTAILETFPEPNRRLLQRILLMMQRIAEHKAENRMSVSAVAACMSPLLLRPLLAGECELEKAHMDVAGDGSFQLLQAAAAANHAQAIVITLLEEYDNIFVEGSISPELFSDSEESYTGSDEGSDDEDDDDETCDDEDDDYDDEDASGTDGDYEHSGSETGSESGDHEGSDSYDEKKSESYSSSSKSSSSSSSKSRKRGRSRKAKQKSPKHDNIQRIHSTKKQSKDKSGAEVNTKKSHKRDVPAAADESGSCSPKSSRRKASAKLLESASQSGRPAWGRTPARKNPSVESIDYSPDDEEEVQRLEDTKAGLENEIAEKANHNANLQANLKKRKKDLLERRLALEKDVARLQDQLQREKDIGAALESGDIARLPPGIDEKMKAEIKEIVLAEEKNSILKQRVDDLGAQINQQRDKNSALIKEKGTRKQETSSRGTTVQNSKDTSNSVERSSKDTSHNVDRPSKDTSRNVERSSKDTSHNVERSSKDTSRNAERSSKDTSHNVERSSKDTSHNVERSSKDTSHNVERSSKDTSHHVERSSKETSHNVDRSTRNEGQRSGNIDGANRNKDGKKESSSLSSNILHQNQNQNQQNDPSLGTSNVGSQTNNPLAAETPVLKSLGSTSKKSGKGEERRNQIANELENLDKGKGSSALQSSGKGKAPEEKSQGSRDDSSRQLSSHTSSKGATSGTDNKDVNNNNTSNNSNNNNNNTNNNDSNNNKKGSSSKSDKPASQNTDIRERKQENQPSHHIDRLKPEGQSSSKSADKGRQQQDGKHSNPSSSKVTR